MKRNQIIVIVSVLLITFITGVTTMYFLYKEKYGIVRSATTALTQIINSGTLTTDIVDASYVPVSSPSLAMSAKNFSFSCQSSTGTLGTATQQLYVQNPDAADGGWTLTIAATSGPTSFWHSNSSSASYDYNDSTSSGCTDGDDTDSLAGQMTIDASSGTLAKGNCASCTVTNITKGSQASFAESSVNSITLLNAAPGSDDIGDWKLTGVGISQTIPPEQPAASDYSINLTITVAAV